MFKCLKLQGICDESSAFSFLGLCVWVNVEHVSVIKLNTSPVCVFPLEIAGCISHNYVLYCNIKKEETRERGKMRLKAI